MQIVKKIIIDLSRKGTANVIDAVQYDVNTRVVEITLLQNGIPWNVPDGVTAAVGYKKSDGTRGLYDQLPDNSKAVSISGNVITAILVGQVLTVSGMVKASILMHDSNLNQLTTFPFDVNVVPNPSGTEEVSNDYYKYTTMQAVSDAVDAWLTETNEKQDTFLEAGSKALEVIKETINDGEDAPPIICAANGEVIAVSDASDRLFRGLHIYGKTIQNGTPTPVAPIALESAGSNGTITIHVHNQTVAILTPNGLPGIPVSSGGNYTDENGQMWICDEIDFVRGKYVQRVNVVNLATLNPAYWYAENNYYAHTSLKAKQNTAICTHFKNGEYGDCNGGAYYFAILAGRIIISNYGFGSLDNFKEFIANNDILVVCPLVETIETDLTAEQIAQYSALHTNYPNTTIYNDEGAGMAVKYVADTKLYIDHKFNELSHAILNNA